MKEDGDVTENCVGQSGVTLSMIVEREKDVKAA